MLLHVHLVLYSIYSGRKICLFKLFLPLERGNRSSKQLCEISNYSVCDSIFCFFRGGFLIFCSEKTFQLACQNSVFFSCLSPPGHGSSSRFVHMFRWGDIFSVMPQLCCHTCSEPQFAEAVSFKSLISALYSSLPQVSK